MRVLVAVVLAGCGSSGLDDVVGPFTGETHRYALDSIELPSTFTSARDMAGDLDGNQSWDNQLGSALAVLSGQQNVTEHGSDMIAAGVVASSLEIIADDLTNDPSVGVRYLGTPSSPYVIVGGRLEDGRFRSSLTAYTRVPGEAELHLPVFTEADPSLVTLVGMEMILEPDSDGGGGFTATIHGMVPHDIAFLQAVHTGIAQMVASDPGEHRGMLVLVDTDHDGVISYVEVENSSILASLLFPDIQLGGRKGLSFGFRAHFRPCAIAPCTEGQPFDHCFDRVLDGDETALDCGGGCQPCEAGATCSTADDCETALCESGTCGPPSCTNGVRDGLESDVDCGGDCNVNCKVGQRCYTDGDCISGMCHGPYDYTAATCAPAP